MDEIVFKSGNNRKQRIEILFENDDLIVVNKCPYLPVIPDRYGLYTHNLRDLLGRYLGNQPLVVHRIDADTSGIVLFAKNELLHQKMNILFENHQVCKEYLAIVNGSPGEENGIIDMPIAQSGRRNFMMEIHANGKEAKTEYKVLEKFSNYSLLHLKPQSGRTHQIRVHLNAIGCPLAVDPLYGIREQIDLSMIKKKYRHKGTEKPVSLCDRLTLHAHRISFENPLNGKAMSFEATAPKDFNALLNTLQKWDRENSYKSQKVVYEE